MTSPIGDKPLNRTDFNQLLSELQFEETVKKKAKEETEGEEPEDASAATNTNATDLPPSLSRKLASQDTV